MGGTRLSNFRKQAPVRRNADRSAELAAGTRDSGPEVPDADNQEMGSKADRADGEGGDDGASPLAKRPHDLRHACVSTWFYASVAAPQVAERAGHSVEMLLSTYAKCIQGQEDLARKRIQEALEWTEPEAEPDA